MQQEPKNRTATDATDAPQANAEPTVAPGLEDDELYADATREEINDGDSTTVTRLSWDEHENGS